MSSHSDAACASDDLVDNDIPQLSSDDDSGLYSRVRVESFKSELAKWVDYSQITCKACDGLLDILRKHGFQLLTDCWTLLQTQESIAVMSKCGGQYNYFGLNKCSHSVKPRPHCPRIQRNIDGIPLHKSSGTQFEPILCSVNDSHPMTVAVFLGKGKPSCVEDFPEDFVVEFQELAQEAFACGYCESAKIPVLLHYKLYVMPQLGAFAKNTKGHTVPHIASLTFVSLCGPPVSLFDPV